MTLDPQMKWMAGGVLALLTVSSAIGWLLVRMRGDNPTLRNLNARVKASWVMVGSRSGLQARVVEWGGNPPRVPILPPHQAKASTWTGRECRRAAEGSQPMRSTRVRVISLTAGLMLTLAACGGGGGGGTGEAASSAAASPAGVTFKAAKLGGGTLSSSSFKGKDTVLWFWAIR